MGSYVRMIGVRAKRLRTPAATGYTGAHARWKDDAPTPPQRKRAVKESLTVDHPLRSRDCKDSRSFTVIWSRAGMNPPIFAL